MKIIFYLVRVVLLPDKGIKFCLPYRLIGRLNASFCSRPNTLDIAGDCDMYLIEVLFRKIARCFCTMSKSDWNFCRSKHHFLSTLTQAITVTMNDQKTDSYPIKRAGAVY